MILKNIIAKVGRTEWQLQRVDETGWKQVTGNGTLRKMTGHPVYYRIIPDDELECQTCGGSGFDSQGTGYSDVCGTCGGQKVSGPPYEVWPLPSPNVELIPQWDEQS